MLRRLGSSQCPKCSAQLIHCYDLANDWIIRDDEEDDDDPRLCCPECGFSRPVVYAVERTRFQAEGGLRQAS